MKHVIFHIPFILFSVLFCAFQSFSVNLKIRIYSEARIDSLTLQTVSGKYVLIDQHSRSKTDITGIGQLTVNIEKGKLRITGKRSGSWTFDSIKLKGTGFMNAIKIKPCSKKCQERIYNDNLIIRIRNQQVQIINEAELEHYIPGVVEAESGYKDGQVEFYKMQAIICRTYALKNNRKHIHEGYNLCDKEHCQVYKGRCNNAEILLAVTKTAGDVIIDSGNKLIDAAFHANCGGQTVNCEDVWTKPHTYLKSVEDTFCINMSKALWEKTIAKKDMIEYLTKNNIRDSIAIDTLMRFRQTKRKALFYDTIRLKQVREYFGLKSAFFSIYPIGDSLIIKGRGNGHGIGLCQEGAMNMVMHGKNYSEVIDHYYKNVRIVNFNKILSQKSLILLRNNH